MSDPNVGELLAQASAPLLAVKPIFWFAGFVAAGVFGYTSLIGRLEQVEKAVYVLTVMECRRNPNDSLCAEFRQ